MDCGIYGRLDSGYTGADFYSSYSATESDLHISDLVRRRYDIFRCSSTYPRKKLVSAQFLYIDHVLYLLWDGKKANE